MRSPKRQRESVRASRCPNWDTRSSGLKKLVTGNASGRSRVCGSPPPRLYFARPTQGVGATRERSPGTNKCPVEAERGSRELPRPIGRAQRGGSSTVSGSTLTAGRNLGARGSVSRQSRRPGFTHGLARLTPHESLRVEPGAARRTDRRQCLSVCRGGSCGLHEMGRQLLGKLFLH